MFFRVRKAKAPVYKHEFEYDKPIVRKSCDKPTNVDVIKAEHPTIIVNHAPIPPSLPVIQPEPDAWSHQVRLIEYPGNIFRLQESLHLGNGQHIHSDINPTRYSTRAEAQKVADAMKVVGLHKA
jgi:hypothetical protein